MVEDVDSKYRIYGSLEFTAKMGGNSLRAGQEGNNYVEFLDYNHKIVVTLPKYILGGTVMGDRTLNMDSTFIFTDLTFGYKAVLIFNPILKSGGMFSSHTYPEKSDEFRGYIYLPIKGVDTSGIKYKKLSDIDLDLKKKICDVSGSWLKNIIIDDKEWWSVDDEEQRPFR